MSFSRGLVDIVEAFEEGRFHTQRFLKNNLLLPALATARWTDISFTSGQPAYDARIGISGEFTPCIASRNSAIYFPEIPQGMTRVLVSMNMRTQQSGWASPTGVLLFDLLGYYPLLDGDSEEAQLFDNTKPLPRYATGEGVYAVLVNHVSPQLNFGQVEIEYVDSEGHSGTAISAVLDRSSIGAVCSGASSTSTVASSPYLPLSVRGVRSITSVRFSIPPSGLWCIYLVKPLATVVCEHNPYLSVEKCLGCHNGFSFPVIQDGAWINWFVQRSGASSQLACFGDLTFVWG